MSKKRTSSPEFRASTEGTRRSRHAHLLAPAALAALIAGGDARAASEVDGDPERISARPGAVPGEPQLRRIAEDPDPQLRARTVACLAAAMYWMSGWERTEIVAAWASSDSPRLRIAIASALRYAPPTVGDQSAIEYLSADLDPEVRLVIAEAAWLRQREAPGRLRRVLARLADDPDTRVRSVALLALEPY